MEYLAGKFIGWFYQPFMESFRFDHTSYLSLSELQSVSIRSTQWLEESFMDPFGRIIEITYPEDDLPVFASFGFCEIMLPILYIFELDFKGEEVTLRSRQARILTREEVKSFYCRK